VRPPSYPVNDQPLLTLNTLAPVLPLQTFPLILNHSDPILALEHLSQNFPLYSSAFAGMDFKADTKSGLSVVDEARYRELWRNRQIWAQLRGGRAMTWQGMRGDGRDGRLWIGAREVAETEMDLFQCVSWPESYPYEPVIEADYLTRVTDSLLPLLREALNHTTNLIAEGNTPTGAYSTVMKHLHGSRQVHYNVFSANARSGRS
jgi:hypothetical protein